MKTINKLLLIQTLISSFFLIPLLNAQPAQPLLGGAYIDLEPSSQEIQLNTAMKSEVANPGTSMLNNPTFWPDYLKEVVKEEFNQESDEQLTGSDMQKILNEEFYWPNRLKLIIEEEEAFNSMGSMVTDPHYWSNYLKGIILEEEASI